MPKELGFSDTPIYDEIHGYINTTDLELKIIDSPLFQRLNNIRQLGMTYRVFPGAQHTRFSHSLGVMHIIDKMAQSLKLLFKDRRKLRLAALLHDIGHYPFSHTIETVFTDHNKNEDAKHENFSAHIITNLDINDILRENYSKKAILEIASIIKGSSANPLHNQLMTSDLDADRLDYLIRDTMHTGVPYGRIDLDRILHTVTKDNKNYLAIREEGKQSAEGYVISRYLMWATVYTHKTAAGFDEIVQHAFPLFVDDEYSTYEKLTHLKTEELLSFNDSYIISKIYENYKSKNKSYLFDLCRMFVEREHLELVEEAKSLPIDKDEAKKYHHLDTYQYPHDLEKLATLSGLEGKWIFHNNSKTQLPTIKPIMQKIIVGEEADEKEVQKFLRIKKDDGKSFPLVTDKSSIVYPLRDLSLDVVRIFTKKRSKSKVKRGIEKHRPRSTHRNIIARAT